MGYMMVVCSKCDCVFNDREIENGHIDYCPNCGQPVDSYDYRHVAYSQKEADLEVVMAYEKEAYANTIDNIVHYWNLAKSMHDCQLKTSIENQVLGMCNIVAEIYSHNQDEVVYGCHVVSITAEDVLNEVIAKANQK